MARLVKKVYLIGGPDDGAEFSRVDNYQIVLGPNRVYTHFEWIDYGVIAKYLWDGMDANQWRNYLS